MKAHMLLGLALAYSGMLSFCVAMPRHWKQLGLSHLNERWRHLGRPLGGLLLALAGYAASLVWPPAMAWIGWLGMISLAGITLVLLAPYAPRLALWLPLTALPFGVWTLGIG